MFTYKEIPLYSRTTGKFSHNESHRDLTLCDYCGRIIPKEHEEYGDDPGQEVSYSLYENGGCEPMFDQLNLWAKDIGLDGHRYVRSYDIFGEDHSEFFYCRNWDGLPNCEALMVKEYLKNTEDDNWSIYDIMYEARLKMLIKLIKSGEYSLEDFRLTI